MADPTAIVVTCWTYIKHHPQESHCDTCHDDYDSGFDDLMTGELPDGRRYRSCCAVAEMIGADHEAEAG